MPQAAREASISAGLGLQLPPSPPTTLSSRLSCFPNLMGALMLCTPRRMQIAPRRWAAQRPGGIRVLLRWLRLPREAKTEVVGCQGHLGGDLPLFTPLSHSTEVACMVPPQEKSTELGVRVTAKLHWRSQALPA